VQLVGTAITDAFREGRAAEREFVVVARRLEGWGNAQWRIRMGDLERRIGLASVDGLTAPYLYGRLSIVLDILEGDH
jgi:hypothetical protein